MDLIRYFSGIGRFGNGPIDAAQSARGCSGILVARHCSGHGDYGFGIAADDNGNVYITGVSKAAWGSPKNAYAGDSDVLVVKLNSSGELQWNTFLGGPDDDEGNGIVVDAPAMSM